MLEAGFTRVGEFHYLHHDRDGTPYADLAEMADAHRAAAEPAGIGLTLLPVFYAHGSFGGAAPHDGQRRFINARSISFAELMAASRKAIAHLPGANVGIAPHSLRAVTPDELAAIIAARRRRAGPHPCRRAGEGSRGLPGLVGHAPGRNGCWSMRRSISAGA